jgi:hypothetical protein
VMLQQSSHWHIAMPSGGGIHAINRVTRYCKTDESFKAFISLAATVIRMK